MAAHILPQKGTVVKRKTELPLDNPIRQNCQLRYTYSMNLQYSPYAVPLFVAAAIVGALAAHALRRRDPPEARTFGWLMLAITVWALGQGLSISGADLNTQLLFNRLKYLGLHFTSPLWLLLALQYTQRLTSPKWQRRAWWLFVPATALLLVVFSDPWTNWWWPEVWATEFNGYLALGRTHGLAHYVSTAVSYIYNLGGVALYIWFYFETHALYRAQAALMVLAGLAPLLTNALRFVGFEPIPWGLDTFSFVFSGAMMALAIFRFRLLDIVPVARQAIIEQLPDGIVVVDRLGRIVDVNPQAAALLAPDGESLVGATWGEAVAIPALHDRLAALSKATEATAADITLPDGGVFSVAMSPLTNRQGRILGKLFMLRDITARIAQQEELARLYRQAEQAREQLAQIISAASDGIVLLGPDNEILALNPAAEQILFAETYAEFPETLRKWLEQAGTTEQKRTTELSLEGQVFQVVAAPIPETGLVFTLHDVTHFKNLARLKDEFVATVSHDLRSPLTSVLGYAAVARRKNTAEEARLLALQRIEESARRMTDLIEDLLSLATVEAEVALPRAPVSLTQLAREAVEDLGGAALGKGLELVLKLPDDAPDVFGNAGMLAQVWRNLISNALKYTLSGTITVQVVVSEQQVTGRVSDTGIGIPSAALPYVFDKFYRVRDAVTDEIGGTGLGLALVKSIVERHGGQVCVESVVGEGSTFEFWLPRQRSRTEK